SDTTTSESSPTDTTTSETTIADGETLLGDVTCDGDIKSNDLLLLKKYLLGTEELSEQALKNADMTQDNDIKSNDLLLLKKVLLGIE
ncbi:MAG: dockerin type I domain-containing protein, partial [Ruminococcus sp.]|nr:dockerin type I domain-containing protein [Ruminococcus sp.]